MYICLYMYTDLIYGKMMCENVFLYKIYKISYIKHLENSGHMLSHILVFFLYCIGVDNVFAINLYTVFSIKMLFYLIMLGH